MHKFWVGWRLRECKPCEKITKRVLTSFCISRYTGTFSNYYKQETLSITKDFKLLSTRLVSMDFKLLSARSIQLREGFQTNFSKVGVLGTEKCRGRCKYCNTLEVVSNGTQWALESVKSKNKQYDKPTTPQVKIVPSRKVLKLVAQQIYRPVSYPGKSDMRALRRFSLIGFS